MPGSGIATCKGRLGGPGRGRLRPERLAAFVAAVAPGIPLIDASVGIEEPDAPAVED